MTQPDASSAAPAKYRLRWYQYSLRSLLILTLLVAIGLKLTLVWTKHRRMKIARQWVEACLKQEYPDLDRLQRIRAVWPQAAACPAHLEPAERLIVLGLAVRELESPRQRIAGLKLLLETEPAAALPMLREAVDGERDGEVRAWELRLIGLCRDKESVDRVVACLADKDACVRAAAADALGLIHCPGYQVPEGPTSMAVLQSNPPILVYSLIGARFSKKTPSTADVEVPGGVTELPKAVRAALETMMLQGATSDERIAAARALVSWPPEQYRLRVAEWGVWINCKGQLKLVQSVIDEIPKFVHRTGNSCESLADRVGGDISVTKPILHLTADRALAADVQVRIAEGRPWFAFPRPDDFTLFLPRGNCPRLKDLTPGTGRQIPDLSPTAEGYPWIAPAHRTHYATIMLTGGQASSYSIPFASLSAIAIGSIGLRWQSLIISPQRQSWMAPPPVAKGDRYGWWQRLREVPCAWLSSQGESERFLYYDGQTLLASPIRATVSGNTLNVTILPFQTAEPNDSDPSAVAGQEPDDPPLLVQDAGGVRGQMQLIYVEVAGGKAVAKVIPPFDNSIDVDLTRVAPLSGTAVSQRLLEMLTRYGLTAEEAAGLVDVWKRQFFETPGKRLLVVLPGRDYDNMCPLRVRPAPTELVRLAIVLTEL